jgi:putative transposase
MNHWPHAPIHKLGGHGAYMVTAGTYRKAPLFSDPKDRDHLCSRLIDLAAHYGWRLQAWAVLANHYHFIAFSPDDASTLVAMVRHLHSDTARWLNTETGHAGRKVWHSYWDTRLTFERSYLARLRYVHNNPVHHDVARIAADYPWCSAGWFEATATPAFVRTVASFRTDRLSIRDDY